MANEIRDAFNEVYADGPVGSETQPQKSEIRSRIGGGIQTAVDGLDARVTAVEGAADGLPARVTALEATSADHEVRIDNVESLIETGAKMPVAVSALSETNIPIASGVVNGATIGGFVVATGQTVVLTGQTAPAENGAYIVAASGAASRSPLFDTSAELLGATFAVSNGTFQGTVYAVRNETAITIGTTAIVITHAYGTPGNPTQAEVTAARQGYSTVADNLTAMKASTSALALTADTLAQIEGLSIATAKLTEAAGSITPTCFRTFVFANATTYEHVVIAKAAERSKLQLTCNGAGAAYTCDFDLASGICSGSGANLVSTVMMALGGGWYECKAVILTTATPSANVQARPFADGVFPYTGDGVSGVYVRSIVLRIQNTLTNLLPSSDPTNAAFTKTSLTASNTTTPEARVLPPLQTLVDGIDILVNGRLTADKIIEPAGSSSPSLFRANSWISSNTFVFEVIAKKAERTRLNLFSNAGAIFDCTFDLLNGTCSGTGATITALGGGWYRCRVSGTATGTASANLQHRIYPAAGGHPYVGDGVSGLYLQQSSLNINGGQNVLSSPTDYSVAAWSKSAGLTVSANSGRYLGMLSDPTNLGTTYEDGHTALVGKKWTALGSSITAQGYYTGPLATKTGMVLTNAGVSGASLAASNTGYTGLGIYNAIATIPTDAELVTVEVDINGFGAQECTLGALNNTTTATEYGALFAAVVAIRARAPNAKIVFLTAYSGGPGHATHKILRVNGQGNTLDQFQKAVRDVAKLTGWPCIDVGEESGIGYFTSALYMSDELHLNAVGGDRYASFVAERLRSLARDGFFGA